MITTLEAAQATLAADCYLGYSRRPLYLLPLLRAECLTAAVTVEAADAGWDARFSTEMISLEEQLRAPHSGHTHFFHGARPRFGTASPSASPRLPVQLLMRQTLLRSSPRPVTAPT
ncbi:hypothetical protein [Streptomyces sp. NPDC051994]|uniref:hypothetical protein n=1 Tax=unclassified Streptomyces TaxID=2593676 RepID=UPI003413BFC2